MTVPAAVIAGPSAVAVAGAWFFPWLVAAIAYYHSVSSSDVHYRLLMFMISIGLNSAAQTRIRRMGLYKFST